MKPCECGCGQLAPIASKTNTSKGHVKGQPMRFINGHQMQGALNGRWKGGTRDKHGYVLIWRPDHPHAVHGCVLQHRLVVETALGKVLRLDAPVHHVNEDKADNRPANLVACNDNAYHMLLHRRQRALDACGNPDWRLCSICGVHDDPRNMSVRDGPGGYARHSACSTRQRREAERKAAVCAA